jgi:hypothetical protein
MTPDRVDRIRATARSLLLDAVTAEVVRELQLAGVTPVLLKGPALARWLYDDGAPRPYSDCDLLVPPADWEIAQALLPTLGFSPLVTLRDHPNPFHAETWWRPGDAIELDMHRTLPGIGATSSAAWDGLSRGTETIVLDGVEIATLGPVPRALHLALNAVQPPSAKALQDLERALARSERESWVAARELAERLDALPSFGAGLRLLPEGRELADSLGLRANTSVQVALLAMGAPTLALSLDRLAATAGLRAKVTFLARKLVPTRRWMTKGYPLARRGSLGMTAAYVWRPIRLASRAAPAVRAWRRARRETPRS